MGKFGKFLIYIFGFLLTFVSLFGLIRLAFGKDAFFSLSSLSPYFEDFSPENLLNSVINPLNDVKVAFESFTYQLEWYEYIYKAFVFLFQIVAVPIKYIISVVRLALDFVLFIPYIIAV